MKKKFLLGIIPALLALSSCAGLGPKEDIKEENLFVEDTLAHEEVFGEAKIEMLGYKNPLREPAGPVAPVYGVQYQDAGDNVHMRFIAAIWLANSSISVEWARTMYRGHGDDAGSVFKPEIDKECTKAYTSLANGTEDVLTIASINAQYGNGDDYNCFVVYTMLNIPKATYSDYSIMAYIKLNDVAPAKGIAATVGGTANAVFDLDRDGHFISGRFNGTHDEYAPEYDALHVQGGDNAVYYDVDLEPGDTIALVYRNLTNNVLLLNGTSRFINNSGYFFNNSKKTMTAQFTGTYNLYLNGSDEIHTTASRIVRPLYVRIENDSWWDGSAKLFVYAYGFTGPESSKVEKWFKVGDHLGNKYYLTTEDIDTAVYTHVIVVRENPAYSNGGWDGKWNQTGDIALPLDNKNCIFVYGDLSDNTSYSVNTASLS